jgi:hypothetical protein
VSRRPGQRVPGSHTSAVPPTGSRDTIAVTTRQARARQACDPPADSAQGPCVRAHSRAPRKIAVSIDSRVRLMRLRLPASVQEVEGRRSHRWPCAEKEEEQDDGQEDSDHRVEDPRTSLPLSAPAAEERRVATAAASFWKSSREMPRANPCVVEQVRHLRKRHEVRERPDALRVQARRDLVASSAPGWRPSRPGGPPAREPRRQHPGQQRGGEAAMSGQTPLERDDRAAGMRRRTRSPRRWQRGRARARGSRRSRCDHRQQKKMTA